MNKTDTRQTLAIAALTGALLVVLLLMATGNDGTGEPLAVRLKNRLHRAHYSGDESTELALRIYRTKNRADAAPLPLKKGSCGWQVELLQRFLNRYCHAFLVEDGIWGSKTEAAIHRYYTNQERYDTPIWNKYFVYVGISYQVDEFRFAELLQTFSASLA